MTEIKNVSMIGLGAVGCCVAPQLIRALPEKNFRVIAGGSRKERLEKNGITVNGIHQEVYVTDPDEDVDPADLLIVTVKYTALPQAIKDIRKHVGRDTVILSLMNGVDSREIIGKEYGADRCLYGICNMSTENLGHGEFHVSPHPNGILIGEEINRKPYSDRLQAVADLFTRAGIDYGIPEDMQHETWWKFLINVGGNCVNTVLRGTQSYFQVLKPANLARRMVMEEALKVGQAMGIRISQADVDGLMDVYKNYPGGNKCSMLQDFLSGRPTENDMLCGYVIRKGNELGIPTPVNQFLYYLIQSLDEVNAGASVVRCDMAMMEANK